MAADFSPVTKGSDGGKATRAGSRGFLLSTLTDSPSVDSLPLCSFYILAKVADLDGKFHLTIRLTLLAYMFKSNSLELPSLVCFDFLKHYPFRPLLDLPVA